MSRKNLAKQLYQLSNHISMLDIESSNQSSEDFNELTTERIQILMTLIHKGPHTVKQLAEVHKVSPPAITRIVKALDKTHYVIKARAKNDQRVVYVSVTRKTRQWYEQLHLAKENELATLLSSVNIENSELLAKSLESIIEQLNAS